ncbi:MAG: nitrous oxide-stimulated promoter family protein [Spirochaetes bacterium]|jgi:hypothetical protein|nr:nitrous oxide-stimulated promoter family protein [Spirochaetota bacterium]
MRIIDDEKKTVTLMIGIYCRANHGSASMCSGCAGLERYAHSRLDECPWGDGKPQCSECGVHCYDPSMRKMITVVMRYSGPRMICRHPVRAIRHMLGGRRKKIAKGGRDPVPDRNE